MPFGRIDDGLFGHKKIRHLLSLKGGSAALGLWTVADSWCNKELTDGHVPAFMISDLGPWTERDANLLVAAKLWTKSVDGYQFHDWEDFNDTREQVLTKRAKEANKKGNQRSAGRARKALDRLMSPGMSPGDSPRESPRRPVGCPGSPTSDTDTDTDLTLATQESAGAPPVTETRASKPRRADEAKQALRAAVTASFRGTVPPALSDGVAAKAAKRVRELVDAGLAPDLASAAQRLVEAARRPGGRWPWSLLDADPVKPPGGAQGRSGRLAPAPGTTAADFEDCEDIETQLARWTNAG